MKTCLTRAPSHFFLFTATSLVLSFHWLCLVCYFATQYIDVIGFSLQLPSMYIGLLFVGIGSAVNALMINLAIVEKQLPVMAMASVFASPLFNICVTLSVIMLLLIRRQGAIVMLKQEDQEIYLPVALLAIPLLLAEFVCVAVYNGFEFKKKVGVLLQTGYLRFFVATTLLLIIEYIS